ncbi:protein starmaker-like [Oncorhynchus clarkii lewisi]|uniref:protein starmaker-like n=1 Tax=Oncorhynchus clarkii lewisi TaxID=490388 RepID=UPI0039B869CD
MLPRKHTYVIISDHIKTVRQAQVERISYIRTISQPITDLIDYNGTLPCRDMGQRLSDPVPEVSHREKPKETQEHKDKPKEKRIPQALTFLQLFTLLSCVKVKKTPFDPSQSGDGRKGTTINDTNNNNDSETGLDYSAGDVKRIKDKSKGKVGGEKHSIESQEHKCRTTQEKEKDIKQRPNSVSPEEQAKETQQKEKKKSIHPAVAALQLFTLFCCGGKVKLRKDQDNDNASDTGSDLSGGDVTTKRVKDNSNGKVGREKDRTEVQLLKSSQDHEPENQRTPRQVKTPVEEIYIRPDSPTLPRAHSSLSQFSLARNLAILPLEWQLPGVPLPTSSMATRTERTPSSTNTSTHAQMETQTSNMNTDTQTTSTSQSQISMVSSETMIDLHTSDSINQTLDMALTPESTKDMITTDEDVKDDSAKDLISTLTDTSMEKSISETSLKDLIAEYEDDNELKDMAASATPATDNDNEDAMLLEIAALFD